MTVEVEEFEVGSRDHMKTFGVGRHPGVASIMKHFAWSHLPARLQPYSRDCGTLAVQMVTEIPDSPELVAGLRKLLEAKDCFVRAVLDAD